MCSGANENEVCAYAPNVIFAALKWTFGCSKRTPTNHIFVIASIDPFEKWTSSSSCSVLRTWGSKIEAMGRKVHEVSKCRTYYLTNLTIFELPHFWRWENRLFANFRFITHRNSTIFELSTLLGSNVWRTSNIWTKVRRISNQIHPIGSELQM